MVTDAGAMDLPPLAAWWENPARRRVTWPTSLDPSGTSGPTRGQAKGRSWMRTSFGFYLPADCPMTPEQRIATARPLLHSPFAGVTGWAALRWVGSGWFDGARFPDGLDDIDIVTGGFHQRPQPGFAISEERLAWTDLRVVDGLCVTSPTRSVAFLMRYAGDLRTAVRHFDMAAYNDLTSLAELRDYTSFLNGWTGVPQLRQALDLCDENAWSPPEVDFRLLWQLDAGLPRPLANVPVFDLRGRIIGTPDLIDPVAGVAGDYDGAVHLEGAQRARDVRREALFREHGLEYVTMLAGDRPDHGQVVHRLRQAYRRAARNSAERRTWTIASPDWWLPTLTVAQRRALSGDDRGRLLAHRQRAA